MLGAGSMSVLSKYTRITDPQVLSASYDESYEAIDKNGVLAEGGIKVILNELGPIPERLRQPRASFSKRAYFRI